MGAEPLRTKVKVVSTTTIHYTVARVLDPLMPDDDLPPTAFTTAVDMLVGARCRDEVVLILGAVMPVRLPATALAVLVEMLMEAKSPAPPRSP